jgi:hypothetical protein
MNTKQFRTQHPQVLADTAQNCVAPTDWWLRFVHHWFHSQKVR